MYILCTNDCWREGEKKCIYNLSFQLVIVCFFCKFSWVILVCGIKKRLTIVSADFSLTSFLIFSLEQMYFLYMTIDNIFFLMSPLYGWGKSCGHFFFSRLEGGPEADPWLHWDGLQRHYDIFWLFVISLLSRMECRSLCKESDLKWTTQPHSYCSGSLLGLNALDCVGYWGPQCAVYP